MLEGDSGAEGLGHLIEGTPNYLPIHEPKFDFSVPNRQAFSMLMKKYSKRIKPSRTTSYVKFGKYFNDLILAIDKLNTIDEKTKEKPILDSLYITISILLNHDEKPLLKSKLEYGALVGTLIMGMIDFGLISKAQYDTYKTTKEDNDPAKAIHPNSRKKLLIDFQEAIAKQITDNGDTLPKEGDPCWTLFNSALTTEESKQRKKLLNDLRENYTAFKKSLIQELTSYIQNPRSQLKGKQTNLRLARLFKALHTLPQQKGNTSPTLAAFYAIAEYYASGKDDKKLNSSVFLPILVQGIAAELLPPGNEFLISLDGWETFDAGAKAFALAHLQYIIRPTLNVADPLIAALSAYLNSEDFSAKIALCPMEYHAILNALAQETQAELDPPRKTKTFGSPFGSPSLGKSKRLGLFRPKEQTPESTLAASPSTKKKPFLSFLGKQNSGLSVDEEDQVAEEIVNFSPSNSRSSSEG